MADKSQAHDKQVLHKLTTTRRMMQEEFGVNLEDASERQHWVFVGDATDTGKFFYSFFTCSQQQYRGDSTI